MPVKIQVRRGTSEEWSSINPVLLEGEQGLETDSNKIKIGNGNLSWNDLPYLSTYTSSSAVFSSSVSWTGILDKPNLIIGISLSGNTIGSGSVILNNFTNSEVSINTKTNFAESASSINSSLITGTSLPSSIVNSNLTNTGILNNLTVSGSVNFNENMLVIDSINNRVGIGTPNPNTTLSIIGSASVTSNISARTFTGAFFGNSTSASSIAGSLVTGAVNNSIHSNTASSISGLNVTGSVINAINSVHSNTASSMNWSGVTGRPTTLLGYGITDSLSINTASTLYSSTIIKFTNASSDYVLSFTDIDRLVRLDSLSPIKLIIPSNSQVNFPIGTKIDLLQVNVGQVTASAVEGVSLFTETGVNLTNVWSAASIIKLNTNSWVIVGSLTA